MSIINDKMLKSKFIKAGQRSTK